MTKESNIGDTVMYGDYFIIIFKSKSHFEKKNPNNDLTIFFGFVLLIAKGQLISECLFEKIVWTKI